MRTNGTLISPGFSDHRTQSLTCASLESFTPSYHLIVIRDTWSDGPLTADICVIAETDNILQELWREIDQDIENTLNTHRWENLMQGQPAAYTLPHEISVDSIWMDHIQGAIVAGRLDSQVLLRGDPRGMEDARADLIDWRRHQWDLWEVDSKGLQGLEKKRAFRVWKGDAARVFREEFPPWRRARMERERSEK